MKYSLNYMLKRHLTEPYFTSHQAFIHVNIFAIMGIDTKNLYMYHFFNSGVKEIFFKF